MPSAVDDIHDPSASETFPRAVAVARPLNARGAVAIGAERSIDPTGVSGRGVWFRTPTAPETSEAVEIIHGGRAIHRITGADHRNDALRILGDRQRAARKD
ncbi:MAG: hypothetical protein ACU0BF_12170 [Paracoccaceae bacterium]